MELNRDPRIADIELTTPNTFGYVLVSAQIDPGSVATDLERAKDAPTGVGEQSASPARAELHRDVKDVTARIAALDGVITVSLFEAVLMHRGTLGAFSAHGRPGGRVAQYDTLLIVKTESVPAAERLLSAPPLQEMIAKLGSGGSAPDVLVASNVKLAAEVDRTRPGVFLVNYFFADDVELLLQAWDYTAGWWYSEGKMLNSELLMPTGASHSDYAIINTARWDDISHALAAFAKPDLKALVLDNIEASGATTMPSLYRLVG